MLEQVDLSRKLDRDDYEKKLDKVQLRLLKLQQRIRKAELPVVVMYEGWDAGGKGGSIRRIAEKLDPRGVRVWAIGAPNEVETKHHYLWRFWSRLPAEGEICIFDRSWYGRVLVERVEHFTEEEDWRRAYNEIREFERTLVDGGTVLVKFWMHISKDEQLKRFKEREENPFKQWKITPEDWRNREKWDDYLAAAEDVFTQTDSSFAPWRIIAGDCKRFARIETANIVADSVERALEVVSDDK